MTTYVISQGMFTTTTEQPASLAIFLFSTIKPPKVMSIFQVKLYLSWSSIGYLQLTANQNNVNATVNTGCKVWSHQIVTMSFAMTCYQSPPLLSHGLGAQFEWWDVTWDLPPTTLFIVVHCWNVTHVLADAQKTVVSRPANLSPPLKTYLQLLISVLIIWAENLGQFWFYAVF